MSVAVVSNTAENGSYVVITARGRPRDRSRGVRGRGPTEWGRSKRTNASAAAETNVPNTSRAKLMNTLCKSTDRCTRDPERVPRFELEEPFTVRLIGGRSVQFVTLMRRK